MSEGHTPDQLNEASLAWQSLEPVIGASLLAASRVLAFQFDSTDEIMLGEG